MVGLPPDHMAMAVILDPVALAVIAPIVVEPEVAANGIAQEVVNLTEILPSKKDNTEINSL